MSASKQPPEFPLQEKVPGFECKMDNGHERVPEVLLDLENEKLSPGKANEKLFLAEGNQPSQYPLQGFRPKYDCKIAKPNGKLAEVYLDRAYQRLSLASSERSLKKSRKRIRNSDRRRGSENSVEGITSESCDEMNTSDAESSQLLGASAIGISDPYVFQESSLARPAKKRLTRVFASMNAMASGMGESNETITPPSVADRDRNVLEKAGGLINSPSNTPISDNESQSHPLPLPSPSASPVQSSNEKPAAYSSLTELLSSAPTTQQQLIDLVLGLSNHLSETNQNHLVFRLLQNVNRSTLSSLNRMIESGLRRDLISNLPLEVSYIILSYLDYKTLCSISRVCSSWHKILNRTDVWTRLLKRDKLITDDKALERELANSEDLHKNWSNSILNENIEPSQLLYKKRRTILNRWMDPKYEPKRISVSGHGSNVVTCLQHDDDKIITGVDDKLINIYSTKTGKLLKVLKGHDGGVWALKYLGNTLVSGSTDRTVRIWNIKTGKCTHVFKGHTSTVRCLDILQPAKIGINDNGEDIVFPEVPLLVTGSRDRNLHVWKLPIAGEEDEKAEESESTSDLSYDSNELENPYLISVLYGHTQSVRSVSGYGNIVISGSYDTTVRVWDLLDNGNCKHILMGHTDRIYSTALNFNSKICYSGSMDSSIKIWDIEKGLLLSSLQGHSSLVGLLELSDDYLVSAAADSTLRVWNAETGENQYKLEGHSGAITCFQHDSHRIVSGSEKMLKLWDIKTGKFVRDLLSDATVGIWQVRFDFNRCIAAVQRSRNEVDETFIEILDFSEENKAPAHFHS